MSIEKAISPNVIKDPLYIKLYEYYKDLISSGVLKSGTKLPSIRRCSSERLISKTTVESAYLQLAAEGYVTSRPGSGFYVNDLNYLSLKQIKPQNKSLDHPSKTITYDFSTSAVDLKSFNFDIWSRYIKSALRNNERLLSYGDPQGESDLRAAISSYIAKQRGVVCNPDQIVIGAGIQSLLHIICSLTGPRSPVYFTGSSFEKGQAIFDDRGFRTVSYKNMTEDFSDFEKSNVKIIYTSPSHVTPWGDVMPMQQRLALLSFAQRNDCLIIEDDYDSEFRYYGRPVPSLQGLDGGHKVIYMGTFSKLLLPSLRISFMVLPVELMDKYNDIGHLYNQTTSKTEQIALCQFIRDGHLERQIKKSRKLYMAKSQELCSTINRIFKEQANATPGTGGFLIKVEFNIDLTAKEIAEKAENAGILVNTFRDIPNEPPKISLSCSGVSEDDFEKAIMIFKESLTK